MKKRLIPLMLVLLLLTGCEKKEPEPEVPVETEDVASGQDNVINYGGCSYNNEETTVEHLSPSMMACTDSEGREYTVALVQSYETYYKRAIAKKYGNLGDVYGAQWRHWEKREGGFIDQIADVIKQIKETPDSRRMIVTAWNPEDVPTSALPPCHVMFQFYVVDGKISVQLYQRSGDMFLGVPFNIASYSLLLNLIARETGLQVGEFIHTLGDAHIYRNHFKQVEELLSRKPYDSPQLWLNPEKKNIEDFEMKDIKVVDYQHHGTIKAPVAV